MLIYVNCIYVKQWVNMKLFCGGRGGVIKDKYVQEKGMFKIFYFS